MALPELDLKVNRDNSNQLRFSTDFGSLVSQELTAEEQAEVARRLLYLAGTLLIKAGAHERVVLPVFSAHDAVMQELHADPEAEKKEAIAKALKRERSNG